LIYYVSFFFLSSFFPSSDAVSINYVLSFRYHALQRRNPNAILKLPDTQNNIDIATNEPVVGGVYLRLFIASPAWALRKPKEFLSELMDTTLTLMSKEKTDVSINIMKIYTETYAENVILTFILRLSLIFFVFNFISRRICWT